MTNGIDLFKKEIGDYPAIGLAKAKVNLLRRKKEAKKRFDVTSKENRLSFTKGGIL